MTILVNDMEAGALVSTFLEAHTFCALVANRPCFLSHQGCTVYRGFAIA